MLTNYDVTNYIEQLNNYQKFIRSKNNDKLKTSVHNSLTSKPSSIVWELSKSDISSEYYVRVLYDSNMIEVCGPKVEYCPIEEFLQSNNQMLGLNDDN